MNPLRILLADDHAVTRRGVKSALQDRPGWKVIGEATDGLQALEQTKKLLPDIVILDVSMPGMNGLEVARRIHTEHPKTAILILTMHDSADLARELQSSGASGYVLKSQPDSVLMEAVEKVIHGRTHWPAPSNTPPAPRPASLPEPIWSRTADAPKLTPREREIVQLVTEGRSSKEVADVLQLSIKTVESHRTNILQKLKLRSVSDLVRFAIRHNIIQP